MSTKNESQDAGISRFSKIKSPIMKVSYSSGWIWSWFDMVLVGLFTMFPGGNGANDGLQFRKPELNTSIQLTLI